MAQSAAWPAALQLCRLAGPHQRCQLLWCCSGAKPCHQLLYTVACCLAVPTHGGIPAVETALAQHPVPESCAITWHSATPIHCTLFTVSEAHAQLCSCQIGHSLYVFITILPVKNSRCYVAAHYRTVLCMLVCHMGRCRSRVSLMLLAWSFVAIFAYAQHVF